MLKFAAAVALVLGVASASPTPGNNNVAEDPVSKRATDFWYPNMDHTGQYRGYAPDLDGDYTYQVYKSVNSGDGDAIQAAINDDNGGKRHGQWLASQPRVVFIPGGTYEIKKTIYMNTDTILMGDPTNPPVLKAAAGFSGDQTLISGQDPTTKDSGELSFAVGLKNLVLDTTNIPGGNAFTALWWGVAQAAQLQNIKITMASSQNGQGHSGIRLGRGSTLGLSDVRVERGQNGIWHDGHQQAAYKNIYFYQNTIGMLISGGNTITITASTHVDTFTYANTVGRNPIYGATSSSNSRPGALAPGGRFPAIPAPNYRDKKASDFINVKDPSQNGGQTILGDHTKDESAALNKVLQYAAQQNKIAYFPFGKYRVDSTLFIPLARASSARLGRPLLPIVSVGRAGDVGVAQIQDMRFTVSDVLPGAIILQFNMAGNAPGDVALWNSLVTVGGTRGASGLTNSCGDASNECKGAFIGMHFTKSSSAYVENVWNWVADHITEDFSGGSSIAAKGGALVESTKATWLHALGSEHWWLYQLNLRNANNVFISMLQAETNYEQGDNVRQIPPAPWTADKNGWGDPDFSWCGGGDKRCRMGPANYINGGSNVYTYGSAAWAFFSGPGYQGCGQFQCQQTMHWIAQTPSNLQAFGLCSKDAETVLRLADGTRIKAQEGFTGSWPGGGGDVGRYTP
ncbi:hypothetical protein ACCO45_007008 [Purpureocillium lilacinum]|uniref:Uncharacterized protein n=1 Tax=Purpureocillium lilacinum TaxID=33203 RepID=A0ACC4DR55_PURLI